MGKATANREPTMDALIAELAELRAALAQQQTMISALQREVRGRAGRAAPGDGAAGLLAHEPEEPGVQTRRTGTSRRGFLRGAAAATAAATVASVALGAAEQAHAASETTGGNLVLGQANDANATTTLTNTSGTTPSTILQVTSDEPNAAVYGIQALTLSGPNAAPPAVATGSSAYAYQPSAILSISDEGYGMQAVSLSNVDLAMMGTGRMLQNLQYQAGAPTKGLHSAGESIRDANGDLWLCIQVGTPGIWVKVPHLAPGITAGGVINYLSKPIRLFDSRPGAVDALFTPHQPCAGNSSTSVQVSGDSYGGVSVPATLAGAVGNVTITNASGGGFLELVPSGAGFTGAANLAFDVNQTISNAYNVGLSSAGALDIYIGGSSSVDVIVDLFAVVS